VTFSGPSRHHDNVDNDESTDDDCEDGTMLTTLQARFAMKLLTASPTWVSTSTTTPRYEVAIGLDDYIIRACRLGKKMGLNTTAREDARLETTMMSVSRVFTTLRTDSSPTPSIAAVA
jgi:hypothetical protein